LVSVEQAPGTGYPFISVSTVLPVSSPQRSNIQTPNFVDRYEFAPRVTVPLHLGSWLGVTTSAAFRTTSYGDSLDPPQHQRLIHQNATRANSP